MMSNFMLNIRKLTLVYAPKPFFASVVPKMSNFHSLRTIRIPEVKNGST